MSDVFVLSLWKMKVYFPARQICLYSHYGKWNYFTDGQLYLYSQYWKWNSIFPIIHFICTLIRDHESLLLLQLALFVFAIWKINIYFSDSQFYFYSQYGKWKSVLLIVGCVSTPNMENKNLFFRSSVVYFFLSVWKIKVYFTSHQICF